MTDPDVASNGRDVVVPVEKGTVTVLGVTYTHMTLPNGDDLYLTRFGLPFVANLLPQGCRLGKDWFTTNSTQLFGHHTRLEGTSCVYKVHTTSPDGRHKDIVLKWNRMGQDVIGAQKSDELLDLEFNSPYEEFALVMEMRNSATESPGRIRTHKPLAIYVPARKTELWRLGRNEYKMQTKIRDHSDVNLDIFRSYAVMYEWIKGMDAAEACRAHLLTEQETAELTLRVEHEMKGKGFAVGDRKPHHIILRSDEQGNLLRDRGNNIAYAVVDFELLARTPEREQFVREIRRGTYLQRQVNRFDVQQPFKLPAHLHSVNVMGVDYVWGHAESTKGALWVVGNDPTLFDYFLPERWRLTPRTRLSVVDQIYLVTSKDNIKLVWKVSRVGQQPDMDPFRGDDKLIMTHGYNSPFEEVALSVQLNTHGVPTTYPRAIYMTGHTTEMRESLLDETRYATHKDIIAPDGLPVLRKDRDYIIIWGYWNKPDEMLAADDGEYYQGIDALQALRQGLLSEQTYLDLMQRTRSRLEDAGVRDLNLRGNHILISLDNSGHLVADVHGHPEARICNFELLQNIREEQRECEA